MTFEEIIALVLKAIDSYVVDIEVEEAEYPTPNIIQALEAANREVLHLLPDGVAFVMSEMADFGDAVYSSLYPFSVLIPRPSDMVRFMSLRLPNWQRSVTHCYEQGSAKIGTYSNSWLRSNEFPRARYTEYEGKKFIEASPSSDIYRDGIELYVVLNAPIETRPMWFVDLVVYKAASLLAAGSEENSLSTAMNNIFAERLKGLPALL